MSDAAAPWRAAQEAMRALDIDALVLTGVAAQEHVAGHRRIRVFQSDPPGPALVLTSAGPPHVCTPDPDGATGLPEDHVHPIAFDPSAFTRALSDRLGDARTGRIAADRAAPGAYAAIEAACPDATLVDAGPLLDRLGVAVTAIDARDAADPDALVAPRRARALAVADAQGIAGWWFRTPEAIRLLTGEAGPECRALAGERVLAGGDLDAALEHLPRRGRIAVDRLTIAERIRLRATAPELEIVDGGAMVLAGSLPRTELEVAALHDGYRRTERAVEAAREEWRAGMTERECSDALARAGARLGLRPHIDHVVTVVEPDPEALPWRLGAWATRAPWRQLTSDRVLAPGDLVALDAGFFFDGYVTDFGATFIVEGEPSPVHRALARRWTEVADRVTDAIRPAATAADLRAAALQTWRASEPPWPFGLYVAHGVGFGGVVPPFAGTDLGVDVERAMTLEPGDVLMIEPYVYETGAGGYRAERCVTVTDAGSEVWTTFPIERLQPLAH